jgi:chromosomal replication initiation ATPase DnaA
MLKSISIKNLNSMIISCYAMPGIATKRYMPIGIITEIRHQKALKIIETVAKFYGVDMKDVHTRKKRSGDLPKVCQFSTYLICQKYPSITRETVATFYGDRYRSANGYDHSAICHNLKAVKGYLKVGDDIAKDIEQLLKLI